MGFVDAKVVFFIISTKFFERKSISGRCFCKISGYSLPKVIWWGEEMADTVLKTKLFGLKVRHFNNSCLLIAFTRSIHALFSM